jgi:hypothetical protein
MTVECLWMVLWTKLSTHPTQATLRLWVSWFSEEGEGKRLIR